MTRLMSQTPLPKVSFIMPTLNAAGMVGNCLRSIRNQTYPHDRYEILVVDGGSTDGTQDIARQAGATVIDDRVSRQMEDSKRLAVSRATGDYIVFVDSDNEITHPDYVEKAVRGLEDNPQALGVEGYYPPSPRMTSLCAYLTHLLHISDPICWLLSSNPVMVERRADVERWTLPPGTLSYPLGANGFVYRRQDLLSVRADSRFQDTHTALYLMQSGRREWLRIAGRGVHHYYVDTWWGFIRKRRRAMVHFLNVRAEFGNMWMEQKPPIPGWLACVYCATFVGPLWHTIRGLVRDRTALWLWHVPASVASLLGALWGYVTHMRHSKDEKLVSRLGKSANTTTLK